MLDPYNPNMTIHIYDHKSGQMSDFDACILRMRQIYAANTRIHGHSYEYYFAISKQIPFSIHDTHKSLIGFIAKIPGYIQIPYKKVPMELKEVEDCPYLQCFVGGIYTLHLHWLTMRILSQKKEME